MKKLLNTFTIACGVLFALLAVLFFSGCSLFEAPTTATPTSSEYTDLWNPQPGDQVVEGHDVPILNSDYWETVNGPTINPAAIRVRVVIGPAGGVIALGLHTLLIPPGALNTNFTFFMTYASNSGVAVDCNPSPFSFLLPVTLTLSYENTQYDGDGEDASQLQIMYMAPDGTLEAWPSTVDESANTVSAQIDHFSRYIIS
jgi:hypothetical protein